MKLAWLLLVAASLAGCSGGGEDTSSGPKCLENQFVDAAGACVDHVEPHIIVAGLPSSLQQYATAQFSWSLDPGTRGAERTVHSMDSRILASPDAAVTDNTTAPDSWGTDVAKQQHKDLPQNFTAAFSWETVETVYVKGYMLIDNEHVWQDLATISVTGVTATGNRTEVAVALGPPPSMPAETAITVGDGIVLKNDDNSPITYELTLAGDSCPSSMGTLEMQGGTLQLDFVVPGSCTITLNTPLSATGEDPGEMTTKVTVAKP